MKYIFVFFLAGVGLTFLAINHGQWWLLWPSLSFLGVAAAYAGLGPIIFGKRSDGTLPWWSLVIFAPFLGLTWGLWHLQRWILRGNPFQEISPGLWLGRRLLPREIPTNFDLIVDLTAEFPRSKFVLQNRTYWCLPTLDASIPSTISFDELVEKIVSWPGCCFIHCANGHGRSATLVAAILIRKGMAKDSNEALEIMRRLRPGVGLNQKQKNFLQHFVGRKNNPGPS
jgi:protein-tyrosine phosphatase